MMVYTAVEALVKAIITSCIHKTLNTVEPWGLNFGSPYRQRLGSGPK
ncbi:hypothetical protein AVDCRST_MAG81-5183 [uncultured Synechococcales cyanobacterium]|uniref:Uncharacterized protein n=1 Tax=uncultured Synechococcales cyanobacterium TaxID=1936017 RepID=A0A6J4VV23_9CYAN|nr:hypothetical protein AVDCRST_MAG81-5183 [uncultured Synechococcales cyanobacterium]